MTVNGTEHIYRLDGSKIISESWGDLMLIYLYDAEGLPIGMQYRTASMAEGSAQTYWYEKNLQGDVVAVYNASGTKLISYSYDAWGNVTMSYHNGGAATSARHNPFTYRGYYYDDEIGLYYLQSRYYDPATGRFLNADGVEYLGANEDIYSYNLYAYCSNNPVMYTDPSGEFVLSAFLICLVSGIAVGATLGGITAYSSNQEVMFGVITGALLGAAVGSILGVGGPTLAGAVSSTLSKTATDLISVTFYGGSYGNWEDYAVAFVFGGLAGSLGNAISSGSNLAKTAKFVSDVALRPGVNQLVKFGTRGREVNGDKYLYDIVTRSLTYSGTDAIMKGTLFGMNVKIDIGKCFYRSAFRSLYGIV